MNILITSAGFEGTDQQCNLACRHLSFATALERWQRRRATTQTCTSQCVQVACLLSCSCTEEHGIKRLCSARAGTS